MNDTFFSRLLAAIMTHAPLWGQWVSRILDKARYVDFLAPLFLRLYLAPVFWMAGTKKFINFTETATWFGDSEWGLGLPAPYVLVFLVALFETLGALFLLFGFAVRLMSLPLMVIMLVAAVTAHLKNGWLAIATGSGIFATDRTVKAIENLERAKEILQNSGEYDFLTDYGSYSLVMLNNGIEFAATYFVMLLVLLFMGAGRYVSADYWLKRKLFTPSTEV